ncbi:hypothetical protein B9G54_01470 [Alloscardovia macacae]|uniref:tyrosine-type recombinase/integrase n=1 Tax=Alloscardovia macacae TaxID=1160091 RepID=UPI000A2D7F1A|nr:site-specific integrase [Alloscardovia macacae]OTA27217.1 hypothetical protein B9G54_01470 [Alloscardovia macacae]
MGNTRRSFGSIRVIKRDDREYLEASYPTPRAAQLANPSLPKRITKIASKEFRPVLEAWLAEAQKAISYGQWTDPTIEKAEQKANETSFQQYAEKYVETHRKPDGSPLSPTTVLRHKEWLENYLLPAFGHMAMSAISMKDVQDWWNGFPVSKDGKGLSQRWNVYTLLRTIMTHAATQPIDDNGRTLIATNPCKLKVSRPRTEHEALIAEYSELEAIAHAMPDRLSLAIYLGGVVGLREGEICALTRKDIDVDNRRIIVNKSVKQLAEKGKPRRLLVDKPKTTSSYRKPPYPQWLTDRVENHLTVYVEDKPDALVFTSQRRGELIAPQTLRNQWYKALKAVPRLDGMHFHDLRHTALTHWGEAGASVAQLMEVAGHSELKTVTRYQQISLSQRRETARKLDEQYESTRNEHVENDARTIYKESAEATGEHDPLVDVLASLPVESQAQVLRAVDKGRQVRVISQLRPAEQVALLPLLL